ncbi:MAG TPA: tRNA uracil 4-sulfurtransferase ThiI [Bacillota bacterium]|nr:tRNA uracil 4-sulfurtransferase ThiI [Bacillota bacterium]HPT62232.1 tRNA uracil 4-sulfurtransferase ThiI [Bacillota bacterium]
MSLRYDILILRYGELALKGRNRATFENLLIKQTRRVLKDLEGWKLTRPSRRWILDLGGNDPEEVVKRLQKVFGYVSFSPAVVLKEPTIEDIKETTRLIAQNIDPGVETFKVNTRRVDKKFPFESLEVSKELGGVVLKELDGRLKVDVHNPQWVLNVEIRPEGTYLFSQSYPGQGGLPYGSGSKALLLLSGGIDSPVAGYLIMKRGAVVEGLHFHSFPFTSERAKEKVIDLGRKLAEFSGKFRIHFISLTEIQKELKLKVDPDLNITILRRFMYRIAEAIAKKEQSLAIVTGESLGQVASQTLESLYTINSVTSLPILRPLCGMDKENIITIAKDIDTYETSIQPYEDCCTIFLPEHPETKPRVEQALRAEEVLDVEKLIENALATHEILDLEG